MDTTSTFDHDADGVDEPDRDRSIELRYKSLFTNMRNGVGILRPVDGGDDFVFEDFNPAAERIEKTPKEIVLGHKVTEVFPGVREFGLLDVFRRVYKTGNSEIHPVCFYQDERISGWRENYVTRLSTGEIVSVYQDLTQQKQAEEALRLSEERFRTMAEMVPYGLVVIDGPTSTITYATPNYDTLYGREIGASVGRSADEMRQIFHNSDREATIGRIVDAIARREKHLEFSFRLATEEGAEERWITNAARFHYDTNGELDKTYIIAYEITDQKRFENELRSVIAEKSILMSELNHRVKNNLLLVSSLIHLKQAELPDGIDLMDIESRVQTISTLHETLQWSEDGVSVVLESYVRDVLQKIFSMCSAPIDIDISSGTTKALGRHAVPIGLIATEVATNAMKHGFTEKAHRWFRFEVSCRDDSTQIVLANGGKPLPEGATDESAASIGFTLIKSLAEQLTARLEIVPKPHPQFIIVVPAAVIPGAAT